MSVLLALAIDWLWGEPPERWHPVCWFGTGLKGMEAGQKLGRPLFWGSLFFLGAAAGVFFSALLLQQLFRMLPGGIALLLTAIALKPTFAFRMLVSEVEAVELALQQDLDSGRRRLAYIVSRQSTHLSAEQVREANLESLAENLSDSVIAPLFWFVLFGLPGAYLYRFVNTADAMWGYRTPRYQQWGKLAARTDDLLNWVPARLTGLALLYLPPLGRGGQAASPGSLMREAGKTPSPNSGWPMAALALWLGVRLAKPGVYALNAEGSIPDATHVVGGLHRTRQVGWVLALVTAIAAEVGLGLR